MASQAPPRPIWKEEPYVFPAIVFLLAAVALFPRLGGFGLWEPHEIAVADLARDVARNGGWGDVYSSRPPLTIWLIAGGIKLFGTSELAARLPIALMGVLGALATYFLAARLRRPRAGLFAAVVLLSSPLFVFQSRQLVGDVVTTTCAAVTLLGLVGLAWPARGKHTLEWLLIDGGLALVGLGLGFLAAGLVIGVLLPLLAMSIALTVGFAARFTPDGEDPSKAADDPAAVAEARRFRLRQMIGAAGLAVLVLGGLLLVFFSVFSWVQAQPGQWAMGGKTLAASKQYVAWLGGTWRIGEPPATATFNYLIEQVAFGMFPWSALAPIAVLRLAYPRRRDRAAWGGVLILVWTLTAYLLGALFVRKVGEIRFPAMAGIAVAIGLFLDDLLAAKLEGDPAASPTAAQGMPVAAVFLGLAGFQLARDCVLFPDELASVHILKAVKHPVEMKPYLIAVAIFGALFLLPMFIALIVRAGKDKDDIRGLITKCGIWGGAGVAYAFGLFLASIYTPALSQHFSYKNVFESYFDHRTGKEPLGVMGIPGSGPEYYAKGPFEKLNSLTQLTEFLKRGERVFAITPADKLCPLHQASGNLPGQPAGAQLEYHVLDNRNSRFLLLTNRMTGREEDMNPLLTAFQKDPPARVARQVTANFDNKIELVGVDMPDKVSHGDKFKLTLWFHVLQRIPTNYKIFVHFDGAGIRFQGDHDPIGGRCGTSFWQVGDYVADTVEVTAGELTHPRGNYTGHVGFFTGGGGQWKNMPVVVGEKDGNNRVPIGAIRVK